VENARRIGAHLLDGFQNLARSHPLIGEVRGKGMILGMELVRDRTSREPAALEAAKLVYRCKELGLILFYGGISGGKVWESAPLFIAAGVSVGISYSRDFNGEQQEGVGYYQATARRGLRCSTRVAFLRPAKGRTNLRVVTGAHATRILFEGDRAVGVEIARDGQLVELRAEREVILSAGTYQSPVLLMLSGIGPADDLTPLGIEMRQDLPVGHNLQDHCMAQVNYLTDEQSLFLAVTPQNIALLEAEGRGPLSSNIPEAGAFFRSREGLDAPDMEFHFAPSLFYDEGLTAPADHGYCFGPVVIQPVSVP